MYNKNVYVSGFSNLVCEAMVSCFCVAHLGLENCKKTSTNFAPVQDCQRMPRNLLGAWSGRGLCTLRFDTANSAGHVFLRALLRCPSAHLSGELQLYNDQEGLQGYIAS